MNFDEIPPQSYYFHNGLWKSEMDRLLLQVLTFHKEKHGWSSDGIPPVAVKMVELALQTKFGSFFTADEVNSRIEFLENRYKTFTFVTRTKKANWDALGWCIVARPEIWMRLFKKNPLAKAYYRQDEPEFNKLAVLFGHGDVKNEHDDIVITLSDSSSNDDEVRSPPPRNFGNKGKKTPDLASSVDADHMSSTNQPNSHSKHSIYRSSTQFVSQRIPGGKTPSGSSSRASSSPRKDG